MKVRRLVFFLIVILNSPLVGQQNLHDLSDADKLYGLSKFWQEATYNFAYFDQVPELNWDQKYREFIPLALETPSDYEYYRLLKRFCALLKDGHTNVYFPDAIYDELDYPMIAMKEFGHRAFIVNVDRSLLDKAPLGSEIIEVNGTRTRRFLEQEIFRFLSSSTDHILWNWGVKDMLFGPGGSMVTIKIRKPNGTTAKLDLLRKTSNVDWVKKGLGKQKLLEFRWLEDEIAYLALNSFDHKQIVDQFREVIPELIQSNGLLIDIRQNGGGESDIGAAILRYFTAKPFVGASWKTRILISTYRAWDKSQNEIKNGQSFNWKNEWYWGKPDTVFVDSTNADSMVTASIVVLIGHSTSSAAEDFLIYLEHLGIATLVGQPTCGSTGQPLSFDLPGGGSARVCTKRDFYPDGREFVGYGISPDFYVEPSVQSYLEGEDEVLKKGIEVLRELMK